MKKLLLVGFLVLLMSLDKQYYPRVEYRLNDETQSYDVICKTESTLLHHTAGFLIGTTSRSKEAYEIYCS